MNHFISTKEVLTKLSVDNKLSANKVLELEIKHGNRERIILNNAIGMAGPFKVVNPWLLKDSQGHELINVAGYASLPFGEKYPPLIKFVRDFLETDNEIAFPQQSAAAWRAALETNLVNLLSNYAPQHKDSQVFFSNSGAEAVEAALKFARAARQKAKYFITFSNSYHGKTFGALSVTPNESYQAPFRPLLPDVLVLPYGDIAALENTIKKFSPSAITAIIVEPIQGEAGVIEPPPEFLPALEKLRKKGILIIADEIQTGLGRTGHLFASVAGGLEPDIITLAKPLGGGLIPVGATIARKGIMKRTFEGGAAKQHSTTFGGGSLAMAVALKSLEIIQEEGLVMRSQKLGAKGLEHLLTLQADYPKFFKAVRGSGMLFALQTRTVIPKTLAKTQVLRSLGSAMAMRELYKAGVYACYSLNNLNTIRLTPALNMPDDLFEEMFKRIEQVAIKYPKALAMLPNTLGELPLTALTDLSKHVFK